MWGIPTISGPDSRCHRGDVLGVIRIVSQSCMLCVGGLGEVNLAYMSTGWRSRRGRFNLRAVSWRPRRGLLNMRLLDGGLWEVKPKSCAVCRRPRRGIFNKLCAGCQRPGRGIFNKSCDVCWRPRRGLFNPFPPLHCRACRACRPLHKMPFSLDRQLLNLHAQSPV